MLVLNITEDPLLVEEQPRGFVVYEPEATIGSLNPSAVLALSHIANVVIHIHPLSASSSQLPDNFIGGNPTKSIPSTLHWLIPAKQYSPLAQSVLSPHAHLPASVFGDNPSVSVQFGTGYDRHKLLTALQKKPAPDAQSMDPQRHTPGFSVVPDSSAQGEA